MKSVLLLCTVVGAVSDASKCQADENTLLQGRHTMRKMKTAGSKDAKAMLKDAREVANSLVEGSDSTMSQDAVTDTLDAAIAALAELRQATLQQIANAQQQITDASGGFQTCTTAEATGLQQSVAQRAAAVESCQNTLDQLRTAETQQCNTAEDCLCDESRVRTTDQEALCTVVTELYETVFCEHHYMCTSSQQCHSLQAEVYQRLTADVEAEMALIVEEYIAVEQSLCLNRLSREAMTPPRTRISRADRDACDDVDVSALSIRYPAVTAPPTCPAHGHGDPECVFSPWTLVLQYGEEAYPMNAGAVGVPNEDVNGFAKLSDEAINALPSGGHAGFDYYMLTSDPPDTGASDSTTAWDRMFVRTTNIGGYNDVDNLMGISSGVYSWGVCNAASFDECTWRNMPPNRFDTYRGATSNDCNRWFTGVSGLKCYAPQNRNARCFSRGHGCSDGRHKLRANVKVYKLTA